MAAADALAVAVAAAAAVAAADGGLGPAHQCKDPQRIKTNIPEHKSRLLAVFSRWQREDCALYVHCASGCGSAFTALASGDMDQDSKDSLC